MYLMAANMVMGVMKGLIKVVDLNWLCWLNTEEVLSLRHECNQIAWKINKPIIAGEDSTHEAQETQVSQVLLTNQQLLLLRDM